MNPATNYSSLFWGCNVEATMYGVLAHLNPNTKKVVTIFLGVLLGQHA